MGNAAVDIQLHDTYFIVRSLSPGMGSASFFGMLAAFIIGSQNVWKMMNSTLGSIHFGSHLLECTCVFPHSTILVSRDSQEGIIPDDFEDVQWLTDLNMW